MNSLSQSLSSLAFSESDVAVVVGLERAVSYNFRAALVLSPATASAGSKLEDGLALPDGARQFNEFQGLKGEWTRFGERLKKTDIDDKEWEGVPLLLRRVYDAGDDMLFMAKGMIPVQNCYLRASR